MLLNGTSTDPFAPVLMQAVPPRVQTYLEDFRALVDIYRAMQGAMWREKHGWAPDTFHRKDTPSTAVGETGVFQGYSDPCLEHWYGVTCNDAGRVIRLDLSFNGLGGAFPITVAQLQELEVLRVSQNRIEGSIEHLMHLTRLNILEAAQNILVGSIPKAISNLMYLRTLDLGGNAFSGDVPAVLERLSYLESLHLGDNAFDGALHVDLGALENLLFFDVSNNVLTGRLRLRVTTAKAYRSENPSRELDAVSGKIGSIVGGEGVTFAAEGKYGNVNRTMQRNELAIPKLVSIRASNNRLSGTLPEMLFRPPMLTDIDLSRNRFSGTLHHLMYTEQSKVNAIDFSDNMFSGALPE